MQLIRTYFENLEPKIRAQIVGFSSSTFGVGLVGYNEDRIVYSTPLQLFSGVSNPIKIVCLNSDQKPVNVSNVDIQCGLFQPGTQNELITANAVGVDSANGVIEVTFTASQLAPLDFGLFEVALVATDANLVAYPIYINDNYGSRLTTRLSKGPVLAYPNPYPVVYTDQPGIGVVSNWINLTNRPMGSTLATLTTDLNQYTGNIIAMGTMVSLPAGQNDFGIISSTYYSNVSGNIFQNVQGSFAVIEFVVDGIDPSKSGNVSQGNIANVIISSSIRI